MSLIMKSLMSQKPISICEPEENRYIKDIEKLIKKKIQIVSDNPFPQTDKPMNNAEKKAFEKEKQKRKQEFFAKRKQEFFANRKKNNNSQRSGSRGNRS